MRALALLPLLLAACAARPEPGGEPAHVTFFGDEPRLVTWRAFLADGRHVHSSSPGPGCLVEELRIHGEELRKRAEAELGRKLPPLFADFCDFALGRRHGGAGRLALLLVPPSESDPAEALAVVVPSLAPHESEKTFTDPLVELERPAGTRRASIDRGRVSVRRRPGGGYDVELFATLKPGGTQVVARAQAIGVP